MSDKEVGIDPAIGESATAVAARHLRRIWFPAPPTGKPFWTDTGDALTEEEIARHLRESENEQRSRNTAS